jgi:cytochrome c1
MKFWIAMGAAALVAIAAMAADQATLDRGKKEAGESCMPCHSLRLVESQRLSRAAWNKELDKMVGWGTKLNDREAVLEYLVANFGDDKPAAPPTISKDGVPPAPRKK